MGSIDQETTEPVCVSVEPGICGFSCRIQARKNPGKTVAVKIHACDCKQIGNLADKLTELTLRDAFLPLTRNPVYVAAEKSGCHPSCGIPAAVLKAVEVALGMALPRDVTVCFEKFGEPSDSIGDRNHGDE